MRLKEDEELDQLNIRRPRHNGALCAILYIYRNRQGVAVRYYIYKLSRRVNTLEGWIPAHHITFEVGGVRC